MILAGLLLTGFLALLSPRAGADEAKQKAVVVFDYVSKWDEGRTGQHAAEMAFAKIKREGRFVVTEMADVRDTCTTNGITITPETPLDKVKEVVRGTFDADIAIWGQVERVAGTEGEIYDIVMKCVDFTGSSEPKVLYDKSARTNSATEIPHLYTKEMLDKLYDRTPGGPPPLDEVAERAWKEGPNLIVGGDFERGSRGVPRGWEARGGQQREPLGNLVKWVPEKGNTKNHVIRFDIPKEVAENEGVMYYSDYFPVQEGSKYRFQVRYRTTGPAPKVFIKCYDEMASDYRAEGAARDVTSAGSMQRREVYRSQQNLKGPPNTWNTQTEDFTPKHTKYNPKWGRVMLYGYLSPGSIEWDDVVIKQLTTQSLGVTKIRRHSLDTKVTIEEMEANEKRGKEAREKMRKEKEEKKEEEKKDEKKGEKDE
jgi:hypothetical protein